MNRRLFLLEDAIPDGFEMVVEGGGRSKRTLAARCGERAGKKAERKVLAKGRLAGKVSSFMHFNDIEHLVCSSRTN